MVRCLENHVLNSYLSLPILDVSYPFSMNLLLLIITLVLISHYNAISKYDLMLEPVSFSWCIYLYIILRTYILIYTVHKRSTNTDGLYEIISYSLLLLSLFAITDQSTELINNSIIISIDQTQSSFTTHILRESQYYIFAQFYDILFSIISC